MNQHQDDQRRFEFEDLGAAIARGIENEIVPEATLQGFESVIASCGSTRIQLLRFYNIRTDRDMYCVLRLS